MSTTKDTIAARMEKFQWYQSIDLGNGIVTPGETGDAEQRKIAMLNLPDDLSGKSVLDIGSNEGFYSFEAEKRGADKIIAIDKSTAAQEKLLFLKEVFNSRIELQTTDLYDLDPKKTGRFDIVFFLAVFHHVDYSFLALDIVRKLCCGTAYMEYVEAVPESGEDVSALVRKMSKKGHLHMLPTRTFLLEILERAGFSDIEILGTHREMRLKPKRKAPGFSERRVVLKAS
ncbi:MAG: class I SAM-dependent methyltransferase [Candidatus Zixiibacteriota bacterium]